jgi:predicted O-methyltransferase YrrM
MKCPECQSTQIRKNGFYRGKQRYQCKVCARQFIDSYRDESLRRVSTGVDERVYDYNRAISSPIANSVLSLYEATERYPLAKMQPTADQVQLIGILLRSMGAQQILDIGTFIGYSSLAFTQSLSASGKAIVCGVRGEHLDLVRSYWVAADIEPQIDLRTEEGMTVMNDLLVAGLAGSFDAVILNTLKNQYVNYYRGAIDLLRPGGMLIAIDILWQSRVLDADQYLDDFTQGIDRFNRQLAADPELQAIALPVGDGISIAVKL